MAHWRGLAPLIGAVLVAAGLGVAASPADAVPTGYSITGIDVSAWQGTIDWAAVAATGTKFAYVRATEQDGNPAVSPDPTFVANYTGARANGIYAGAYHRARPSLSSGAQQAQVLLATARYSYDGRTLPPMLDIEWPRTEWGEPTCYGLDAAHMVAWIRDFVTEVAARTGRQAMIYTNTNWWTQCTGNNAGFAANPLFLANYSVSSSPPLPAGWSSFTFWQYTNKGTLPGGAAVDLDVFNGDWAALGRLLGGPVLALNATVNNRNVTAENAGASALIANRTWIGAWERFDVVDAGGGYIALRAQVNGKYVTAERAGALPLIANRTWIGAWEKFRIVTNADGTISLQANANGRYVCAENAGTSPLIANRTWIGSWEKFRTAAPPVVTSLLAGVNRRYVTAPNSGASPLIASSVAAGTWERFTQVDAGGGYVALLAANGRYVCAENAGASPLIANRTWIGSWEKFRIVTNADGTVSLIAYVNGRYVTAENAGASPLIANRTWIGSWEKFSRVIS